MEGYFKEETGRTPRIEGLPETGRLRIEGRSLPEDAKKFYRPLSEWLSDLLHSDAPTIHAEFSLDYFNTSTSKVLVDLMLKLHSYADSKQIEIIWEYDKDDPEMAEIGKDFQKILGHLLKLKAKSI